MSTQAIFKVKFNGTYHKREEKQREIVNFPTMEIRLYEDDLKHAVRILRRQILPKLFKEKDPSFVRVRTVDILDTYPEDDSYSMDFLDYETQARLSGRDNLIKIVKRKKLKVPVELFPTTLGLREAVLQALQNPKTIDTYINKVREREGAVSRAFELNPSIPLAEDEVPQTQTPPPDQKTQLAEQATNLGITVKKNWGVKKLTEEIEKVMHAPTPVEEASTPDPVEDLLEGM